jgi:hypothetical protein
MNDFLTELVKDAPALSAIIGALAFAVAVGTFVKGVLEYRKQNALKRFEKFVELEQLFYSDEIYNICMLLERDNTQLATIDVKEKQKFLGFYEQIAIMHNSKLLRSNIAHYMYGYYAVRCLDSQNFWTEPADTERKGYMDKDSPYWRVFRTFASEMRKMELSLSNSLAPKKILDPKKIRI